MLTHGEYTRDTTGPELSLRINSSLWRPEGCRGGDIVKKKENIIRIIDVTNRDGVQTSRLGLAKLQKTMINMYLNDMGIYQSEFGFPVTRHETN